MLRNLVIAVAAISGFVVAQVISSVITTSLKPDPAKERRSPEQPAVVTAAQLPSGSIPAKPAAPAAKTQAAAPAPDPQPQPQPPAEAPVAVAPEQPVAAAPPPQPAPRPRLPAPSRGPGNLDAPRPSRGPGNLDDTVYSPPPPRGLGPGNL